MRGKVQKVVSQKAAENLYEDIDAVADGARTDIATPSVDGEVNKTVSGFMDPDEGANAKQVPEVDTELKDHGAKVNGGFKMDEPAPAYTQSEVFTVETTDMTESGKQKSSLGWGE